MDSKLSYVIYRTHSIIDFLLLHGAVDSIIFTHAISIFSINIRIIQLLIQNTSQVSLGVKFDPRRSKHEVDVAFEFVSPVFDYTAQIELTDNIVRLNKRVHVSFETMLCVHTLLIELDLNEAIRICTNYEVDFCPVDHDDLLYVVDYIRQLLLSKSFKTSVLLRWSEITIQYLLLVKPLGSVDLFLTGFVWIVVHEVWHHVVLLLFLGQEAIMILPVILIHSCVERSLANLSLLAFLLFSLVLLMLEEHGVLIRKPLIITEKTASSQRSYLGSRLFPKQVAILFVIHHFSNGVR